MSLRTARLFLLTLFFYLNSYSQGKPDTIASFYFEWNSDTLNSFQLEKLRTLASTNQIISIKGFADTTGSRAYNLALSKRRALFAYSLVIKNKYSNNSVNVAFEGETAAGAELWQNRKVEIRYLLSTPANQPSPGSISTRNNKGNKHDTITRLNLDHIYFIPDKDILTQESFSYMPEYARKLKQYTTEKFEIIGHVNYQSRFDSSHLTDLYELSERRAKTIFIMLEELGIPPERMSYKGVGNSQPFYPNPVNDEQRRKNMLVEIIIKN